MSDLINKLLNKNYDDAKSLFEEKMSSIVEKKKVENKKVIGAKLEQLTMTRKAFDGNTGARAEKLYRDVIEEKGPGLWANIRAKKARGERMRKPGEEGAPTEGQIKKARGKKIDEQAAPKLLPTGDADSDAVRQMIKSRMNAASPSAPQVGPSTSSKSPFKLPTVGEPSIPANANQFKLPKVEPPKLPLNTNVAQNVKPPVSNMPSLKGSLKAFGNIARSIGGKLLAPLDPIINADPANAGEEEILKQRRDAEKAADNAAASQTNKMLKDPYKSKSLDISKATPKAEPVKTPSQKPAEIDKSSSNQTSPNYNRAGERAVPDMPAKVKAQLDKAPAKASVPEPAKVPTSQPARPITPTPKSAAPKSSQPQDYSDLSFPVAFARAREEAAKLDPEERGKYKFKWKDNEFQTNFAGEKYVAKQKGEVGTDKGPSEYEKKLSRMSPEKAAADVKFQTPKRFGGLGNDPNLREESELDEARINIIKARIRGGKVQRRKKVSNVPGMTLRSGRLIRMSPAERRRRRLGQKRGKIKRRMKLGRTLVKRQRSLRKRQSLGLK